MTLVLSANINGKFAFMTSDTRRVTVTYKNLDLEKGVMEIDESYPPIPCEIRDIKTTKLSNYVLFGTGGSADLADYLRELLKQEISEDHDLSDCKKIAETVIARIRTDEHRPNIARALDVDGNQVSFFMNGFYRDGNNGLVWFTSGKDSIIQEQKSTGYQYNMILPYPETHEESLVDYLFLLPELYNKSAFDGMTNQEVGNYLYQSVLAKLTSIHAAVSANYPIEVSTDFEIHIIAMSKGELIYEKKNYDLMDLLKKHISKTT